MITKILLPTDGSEYSEKTIQYGIDMAKLTGASVTVMYAFQPPTLLRSRGASLVEDFRKSQEEEAKEIVGDITARCQAAGVTAMALVVEGAAAEAIVKAAEDEKPDLIVMGAGRAAMPGFRLGSVVDRVVHHAPVPVLVVK